MDRFADDGKLGQGFTSADDLVEENPRRWHTLLNEALWSYRMACHGSTKVSPYQLVNGHDAVLP